MVLGQGLIDADGQGHDMAGLLPVETSFAEPRLCLGYRAAELAADTPLGAKGSRFRGHEFHYARVVGGESDYPLFTCRDARGALRGPSGARSGSVFGAFMHLVDRV